MFPNRQWNLSGLQKLIRKSDKKSAVLIGVGQWSTGRPRTSHSTTKINKDQRGSRTRTESEGKPQSHSTQ